MVFYVNTVILTEFSLKGYLKQSYKISFKNLGDVVEDVRTVFERLGDTSIYIPEFRLTLV